MNPWIKKIIVFVIIISWFSCGFIGRCMMKYNTVEKRGNWDFCEEIFVDTTVLAGPFNLGAVAVFIALYSEPHWGLML